MACSYQQLQPAYQATLTPCAVLHIFGVSNLVYMQPDAAVPLPAGATVSFFLQNMVSPAYSATNTQNGATLGGATLRSRKADALYVFTLQRPVAACSSFRSLLATASDATGNANNVAYTISFVSGHAIPADGAVTITFPDAYPGDLTTMAQADGTRVACSVNSRASAPRCRVGDAHRIDVLGSGDAPFAANTLYQVVITGLNNPTQSQGLVLTITSLYD